MIRGIVCSAIAAWALVASAHSTHSVARAERDGGWSDTLVADASASSIRWRGTKFGGRGRHEGAIGLAAGELVLAHEQLIGGRFTIDMRCIDVSDIPQNEPVPRRRLLDHLRGRDFFDVERFPTATFIAQRATRIGPARYQLGGALTMHGVTQPIAFPIEVRWRGVGQMMATGSVVLDRQRWGVAYRGARITNDLVDDDIAISLLLVARRRSPSIGTR
jgi:polyisoprenoid-binding protein YceI